MHQEGGCHVNTLYETGRGANVSVNCSGKHFGLVSHM